MLRISQACCLIAVALSLAPRLEPRSDERIFRDTRYGFSIVPPDFDDDGESASVTVAQFCAPPLRGFAANVNVQRQAFDGALKDYVALSEKQFKSAAWQVVSSAPGQVGQHPSHQWTYAADVNGMQLKFRALAVKDGDHVLLVTCTALAKRFDASAAEFDACLASLKLDD